MGPKPLFIIFSKMMNLETEARLSNLAVIPQSERSTIPYQAQQTEQSGIIPARRGETSVNSCQTAAIEEEPEQGSSKEKEAEDPYKIVDQQMLNYQSQLIQSLNLQKTQHLISSMIKTKIDSSCLPDNEANYEEPQPGLAGIEDQAQYQEEEKEHRIDLTSNSCEDDEKVELSMAKIALQVGQFLKEVFRGYSLEDAICMLHQQLNSTREDWQYYEHQVAQLEELVEEKKEYRKTGKIVQKKSGSGPAHVPFFNQAPAQQVQAQQIQTSKRQKPPNKVEVMTSNPNIIQGLSRNKIREEVEKEIAFVFVTKGYGLALAKEQVKVEIDGNKYNSLLTSVIRSALRKLYDILGRNMQKPVQPLQMKEEYLLRSPMINCRKWLTRNEQLTFFKIINIVYGMNQEPIYQDEVLTLYSKVLKQLEKRHEYNYDKLERKKRKQLATNQASSKNKPGKPFSNVSNPYKLQSTNTPTDSSLLFNTCKGEEREKIERSVSPASKKAGGPAIQKEIAELYVTFKSEDSVHLLLSKRHREVSWDKSQIKDVIDKLIKIGLKKVLKFRKEYSQSSQPMPPLNISESVVNKLLLHPLAQQVRIAMVQILMERTLSQERTVQLANEINACIHQLAKFS